ncbi:hypothetical protein M0R45_020168 [Rubus argutus]|uniref:Uncharacterized protein n=1 Tax=Rubus argutus TaxID=59490 RepID=A0AAW1X9D4_RUBAR
MVVATEPGFAPPLASMTPPAIPSKFQIIAASLVLVCHLYGPNVIFAVSSGGGFGGKKESGQLRFGGRERPFRAPICIPYDDLEKLGIPPPPEGRYMSRYQVPSPSRRKRSSVDREEVTHRSMGREVNMRKSNPVDEEDRFHKRAMDQDYHVSKRSSDESNQRHRSRSSRDRELEKKEDCSFKRSSVETEEFHPSRSSVDREERSHKRSSRDRDERSRKRHKSRHYERSTSYDR